MEKITLKPGELLGVTTIPKDVFVEIKNPGDREEEMKIFNILQIFKKEELSIMCSCEHNEFLWLLESHQRGEKRKEQRAFVFKVQLTCIRCNRPISLDIGPSNECYEVLKRNRTQGLKMWSEEIVKLCNDRFCKKY